MTSDISAVSKSYSPNLTTLILWLTLPLLFLPKINLIPVQGQTAGLRIDDFLLLTASFLIICGIVYTQRPLLKIERIFFWFISLALLSVVWNWLLFSTDMINQRANPIVVFRLIEYFTFFYLGQLLIRYLNIYTLLQTLFLINLILVILQTFGIVGGFTMYGYHNVQGGPSGLTAGHWEVGFIFNLIYAVILFSDSKLTSFSRYQWNLYSSGRIYTVNFGVFLFMLATAVGIALSGSRSAALAMIGITAFWLFKKYYRPITALWTGMVLLTCLLALTYALSENLITATLFARSKNLFSSDNVQLFLNLFDNIDVDTKSFEETFFFAEIKTPPKSTQLVDMSWFIRMHKWCYALKMFVKYPSALLIGIGPGYFGIGMDGGLFRLFIEYGLVGGGLFYALLLKSSRQSVALQAILIGFTINMIFLDTYMAYKDMTLYFLVIGAIMVQRPALLQPHLHDH